MIADVNEKGMITLISENEDEAMFLRRTVENNVKDSRDFTDCCNNKKCAFSVELKEFGPPKAKCSCHGNECD